MSAGEKGCYLQHSWQQKRGKEGIRTHPQERVKGKEKLQFVNKCLLTTDDKTVTI